MKLSTSWLVYLKRLSQGFLKGPVSDAPLQRLSIHTKFAGPVSHCLRFAAVGYLDVISGITGLLSACGPAAVSRRIVTCIINAVNGVAKGWAWPHILVEVAKVLSPSIAYMNATTAISGIIRVLRISATVNQTRPNLIFRTIPHPVNELLFSGILLLPATTTPTGAIEKAGAGDGANRATRAAAYPFTMPLPHSIKSYNRPSTESLTDQVLCFHSPIIPQKRGKKRTFELPYWGMFKRVMDQADG